MKCSEARALAAAEVGRDHAGDPAVANHLRVCTACARWRDQALLVHQVLSRLELPAPPEQLAEIVEEGIGEGLGTAERPRVAPAKPSPERSGTQKAAILILTLLGLLAMTLLLLLGLGGEGEPTPQVADVIRQVGQCELRMPGTGRWRELGQADFLPPGTQLRTGPDALMAVKLGGATIHLAPMTAVSIPEEDTLELMVGQLFAEVDPGGEGTFDFVTANGRATCGSGSFTAGVTLKRLRIACLSGQVRLQDEAGPVLLSRGESASMYEGAVSGPVRAGRTGQLAHWLAMTHEYDGRRLVPRQMTLVAIAPEEPLLSPAVALERISSSFYVRGPLAVVRATVRLRNAGGQPWKGSLSLRDVILPVPLAAPAAQTGVLPPGEAKDVELVAFCALRNRSDHYGIGLNPAVWSAHVGRVSMQVDAAAADGIREFLAPTLRTPERRPDAVAFREQYADEDATRPIVLEMRLGAQGADAIELKGREDGVRIVACRLDAGTEPWLSKDRKVFLAFDATGDFGPGGRIAAHEVLEGLIGALPPGCTTALIAFDGKVKFDTDKLMLHLPARAEAMLDRLWQLEAAPGQGGQTASFLARALLPITGLDDESILVLVTGSETPGDLEPCRALLREGRTRLAVLQVGAERPAPGYQSLCAETGGVALAIPPAMAPELGIIDFLSNLQYAGVSGISWPPDPGAGEGILAGPGDFSDQPLICMLRGQGTARRAMAALIGGRTVPVPLPSAETVTAPLTASEADLLIAVLRRALPR